LQSDHKMSMSSAQPMSDDPNLAPAVRLADPTRMSIIHRAEISANAKFLYLCCSFNLCCFDMVRKRTYAYVMENRLEANYPICLGCCLQDCVSVVYFDQIGDSVSRADRCTPFHLFCCIECCGGVAAAAPCDAVNNCCCSCCRFFYPGLEYPQKFIDNANQAIAVFKQGRRLVGPPLQSMN